MMVKLELTKDQAQLLVNVIDNAPFNGVVGQANEVWNAVQQIMEIKKMLLASPDEVVVE